jgi:uncharacterized protein (TIGR02271 family)
MAEHIVATFDSENAADAAARDLEGAGVPASAIRRYRSEGAVADRSAQRTTETTSSTGGGFWAWLWGEERSTETTRSAYPRDDEWYDRRAQAGNTVLGVMVHDDSQIHQAVTILESHHPIEMEENTEEGAAASSSAGSAADVVSSPSPVAGSAHPGSPAAGTGDAMAAASATAKEEVIPLGEENIEIGKRTVDRGTTRVRRYVVETPVERDVTLHGERVTVERRRPVDPAVTGQTFEERTVEVQETEEVPVVEKTARVVEEVAIRKEETERTETVRDRVRREEVEVTGKDGQQRT